MRQKTGWLATLVLVAALVVSQPALAFDSCQAVDFNGDGNVDLLDGSLLGAAYGTADPRIDVDGDGTVGDEDVSIFFAFFPQTCAGCMANLDDSDGLNEVNAADRIALELAYGTDCRGDLNRDGTIDKLDIDLFVLYIGDPAGPGTPASRADFNGDGAVNLLDNGALVGMIGNDCRPDLNTDGAVDTNDLWALLASWGPCPP